MSNVSTILTQLKDRLETVLPATWKELDYIYDDEKNSFRSGERRFGAGVSTGDTVSGTNKAVTFDQQFFIKLVDCIANRSDDTNERQAISDLYDEFENITKEFFQQKLGIPDVVLLVSDISMDDPTNISDTAIMLRGNFTVKHRNQTV